MDGDSYQTEAGVSLQLKAPTGEMIEQAIRLGFPASNNETEYEAILARVDLAKFVSSEKLIIRSNSQLVVGQVNGEYETRDQRMVKYTSQVTTREFFYLEARAYPKGLEWKGKHLGNSGRIHSDKRNGVPSYLLPVGVVHYDQSSESDRQRILFLANLYNVLFNLGRASE